MKLREREIWNLDWMAGIGLASRKSCFLSSFLAKERKKHGRKTVSLYIGYFKKRLASTRGPQWFIKYKISLMFTSAQIEPKNMTEKGS